MKIARFLRLNLYQKELLCCGEMMLNDNGEAGRWRRCQIITKNLIIYFGIMAY
jgi:uncharacterized membrane protein